MIGSTWAKTPKTMTASKYLLAIAALGLNQSEAARFLKLTARSSRRYCAGTSPIPHATAMLLQLMIDRNITPAQLGFIQKETTK